MRMAHVGLLLIWSLAAPAQAAIQSGTVFTFSLAARAQNTAEILTYASGNMTIDGGAISVTQAGTGHTLDFEASLTFPAADQARLIIDVETAAGNELFPNYNINGEITDDHLLAVGSFGGGLDVQMDGTQLGGTLEVITIDPTNGQINQGSISLNSNPWSGNRQLFITGMKGAGTFRCLIVIDLDFSLTPNLAPNIPAGWDHSIVVSNGSGTHSIAKTLSTSDTVYLDVSHTNTGTATTGSGYDMTVKLDGTTVFSNSYTALNPGSTRSLVDRNLGMLSEGYHVVSVQLDVNDTVSEIHEGDNIMTYGFWVTGLGEVSGFVWQDLDADGLVEIGEPGFANAEVYADLDKDGVHDPGEPMATTNNAGSYTITGLRPGSVTLRMVPQKDFPQTYPDPSAPAPLPKPPPVPVDPTPFIDAINSSQSPATIGTTEIPTKWLDPLISDSHLSDVEGNAAGGVTAFRSDLRFSNIDGRGFSIMVIDTGTDLDHPYFGPDGNGDGIADRIVFHYDFNSLEPDGNPSGSDHGSHVASIAVGEDAAVPGVAPGATLIVAKVSGPNGGDPTLGAIERALQWAVANKEIYNIAAVNMSLGRTDVNDSTRIPQFGIGDELAALNALGVLNVCASGNEYFAFNGIEGVTYPSSDPNAISVGATFDAPAIGPATWASGAEAYSISTNQITPFSQRHETLTTVMAPGAFIDGANRTGGTLSGATGTSQASPFIAGVVALAQQLAVRTLGRTLSPAEFVTLLRTSADTIYDGDDEIDNVISTGKNYKLINMLSLGEAVFDQVLIPGAHHAGVDSGGYNFGVVPPPALQAMAAAFPTEYGNPLTEADVWGLFADGDDDLILNWMEWILGTALNSGDVEGAPIYSLDPLGRLTITARVVDDENVVVQAEFADNISFEDAIQVDGVLVSPGASYSTYLFTNPTPTIRQYGRLSLTYSP